MLTAALDRLTPAQDATASAHMLDAERLDVFHVAVAFQTLAAGLLRDCDAILRDPSRSAESRQRLDRPEHC
ncbi:MAG TPA: hypothetical protein VGL15_11260 [Vicinamibacteria bacterium]|jgi:hypothetical protein